MKALLDFVPLIIFFYLYKTVDPKNTDHPLLQLIGSAGGVDNNNILVATTGLIISMLVVYGALFFMQKFRLDKQQWIVLFMTVIFGGVTLMLSDDFYIKLKAALLNIIFSGAFLLSPYFGKERKPLIKRLLRTTHILFFNQGLGNMGSSHTVRHLFNFRQNIEINIFTNQWNQQITDLLSPSRTDLFLLFKAFLQWF